MKLTSYIWTISEYYNIIIVLLDEIVNNLLVHNSQMAQNKTNINLSNQKWFWNPTENIWKCLGVMPVADWLWLVGLLLRRIWSAFLGCWWEFNVFITVLVLVHYFIIAALSFTFKCPSINFSGCDSMVCPITPYIAYYCQLCATSPVPYYDIMLIFPISIISFLYT